MSHRFEKTGLLTLLITLFLVIRPVSAASEVVLFSTDEIDVFEDGTSSRDRTHLRALYMRNGNFFERARSRIRFSLSRIPEDATIEKAVLRLRTYRVYPESNPQPTKIDVHRCSECKWGASMGWTRDFEAVPESTVIVTGPEEYYEWVVTDCIQRGLETRYMTLILNTVPPAVMEAKKGEIMGATFYSKKADNEEWKPQLIVEYSGGTTGPPDMIPGFPLEGIVIGLSLAVIVLLVEHKHMIPQQNIYRELESSGRVF